MPRRRIIRWDKALEYCLVIGLVGAAALVRHLLDPVLGPERAAFPPFFLACALTIRFTSTGPSLAAIALSCLAIDYFFFEPRNAFSTGSEDYMSLALFGAANVVVLGLAADMRRQRNRAEANQRQFRMLFDHSADAVFLSEPTGTIKAANPAACAIFGMTEQELCARGLGRLADLSDPAHAAMAEEHQRLGRVVNREATFVREDGTKFPAETSSFDLPGLNHQSFVILRDISKRKEDERVLRETQERFTIAAEKARAVFGIIQGNKFVWANSYLSQASGYTPEEILAMDFSQLVRPDFREMISNYAQRRQRGEPAPGNYEFAMVTKSGETRWLDFAPALIEYNGRPAIIGTAFDITDRKRAEARLRRFYDSAMMGTIFWNRSGGITDANDKFLQMVGYTREDLKAGRVDWAQMTPPEYRALDEHALEELRATGVDTPYEKEFVRKDGRRIPIVIGAAMLDEFEGIAFVLDISTRRKAEEALRTREAELAEAQRIGHIGHWHWIPEKGAPVVSEAGMRMFGLNPATDAWPGHEDQRGLLYPPGDWELLDKAVKNTLATGEPYEMDVRAFRNGGQLFWATARGEAMRDASGNIVGVRGTIQDITERKDSEQKLRAEKSFADAAINSMPGLFYLFDSSNRFIRWNHNFEGVLGYSAEELPQVKVEDVVAPEHLEKVHAAIQRALSTGQAEVELNLLTKDRRRLPHLCSGRRFDHGGQTGLLGVAIDISERKAIEQSLAEAKEKLHQYSESLEKLVHERTHKLNETVNELAQFSYAITHDMRAPLRAMHGFSKVLLHECESCEHGDRRENLRRIADAAARMDSLITDSLNYSKIVSRTFELEPVDLQALLKGILETYPEFQPHKADIRIEGQLPVVCGNKAGLTQCCSNILSNAVKFVPSGKVPEVRIWAEDRGPFVRLNFQDNGIGIPAEYQEQIWEMFQVLSKEYEGTGIGLAVVRKVMQRIGGSAGVQSEPGKGSCFWLDIKRHNP